MSLYEHTTFIGGLLSVSLCLIGCRSPAQREFYAHCLAAGHQRSSCVCIYRKLERRYSTRFMQSLGTLSLQSPQVPRDFVPTTLRTMQQCQP